MRAGATVASEPEFVPDQRLHPLSWLFVLVASLRQFIVPIIAVLVFGARDDGSLWGLVIVAPLVIAALWRQYLYRYGFGPHGLVIRDGLFFRNVRQIEYERIENIDTVRGPLHRLMNVAEARVETAAGGKPEATIRVLSLDAVAKLRARVFDRSEEPVLDTPKAAERPGELLLHLPTSELVRYGLVDNRGMLIVAAAFGAFAQGDGWEWQIFEEVGKKLLPSWSSIERDLSTHSFALIAGGIGVLITLLLLVRLLSLVWALVTLHGFTLIRSGNDLRVRYGLLTRVALTLRLPRIQAAHQTESLLHRWLGRVSLAVDLAGDGGHDGRDGEMPRQRVRWLAPICTPQRAHELWRIALPALAMDAEPEWQPLAPKARGRIFRKTVLVLTLIAAAPGIYLFGAASAALWMLIVPWAWLHATLYVRHTRWALTRESLFVRRGWLTRRLSIVPRNRVQTVRLSASPFDRRAQMAAITVDTAGASGPLGLVRIAYLPESIAAELTQKIYRSAEEFTSVRGTATTVQAG